ncbi:DUF3367 domain-containing protein [Corynebacterium belfantii]|uniref:DUF3367 domain-containing protein n=1 Tax=Corynebacterium belfantii TaxID=2014537 RepID=UPI0018D4CD67|nr:DUF3367 domain-containing protein [Corynebacterium belfantii]MBG9243787.1 DUF3367 domain-containing protein [Corynebacterium belfantii]MBG9325440.1 DUF3367 domain-containing protein [Corynebacterium belfantii]MBG9333614.1 DUF3367 domain-containing protein [Corynebacterium belfantii]
MPHLLGWMLAALFSFLQPWGLIAADTKHDLVANPRQFLGGALHAWSDTFPLGQVQNQAYGYLFPHGLFFLITDPLPDWVAQRLWWTIVLGVGYSGTLILLRRLLPQAPATVIMIAAGAYALSPRILTTLTAISSEAWVVALVPWIIWPLMRQNLKRCHVAASISAVAFLGAVNATATLAACVPAGLYLLCHRRWRHLLLWLGGAIAVSLWWIIPLLVLGRYAPPFTDYIESAAVTTHWLSLPEILRGTTSWTPFVDVERAAGHELVANPVLIVCTLAVAGLGMIGLLRAPRWWTLLLFTGVLIMGGAHLCTGLLDGPGAALRNIHKFDPLVRLPLVIGLAYALHSLQLKRLPAAVLAGLVVLGSVAPAWSGQLLPQGAYREVPQYWKQAAELINREGAHTRTLVLPAANFARQTWGWTRDEPLQPLLQVPWVARDAVPLVPPEAIRGLDGVLSAVDKGAVDHLGDQLRRIGVGIVVIRHDLVAPHSGDATLTMMRSEFPNLEVHTFGSGKERVDVAILDRQAHGYLTDKLTRVAGGGEALSLLGPGDFILSDSDAEIVTDTPMLAARNYGAARRAISAPLATEAEGKDVANPVRDYPSVARATRVVEHGGHVVASSSAADATAFGGADPTRSITAAVDNDPNTAWFAAPGDRHPWLELQAESANPILVLRTTGRAENVRISSNGAYIERYIRPGVPETIHVPGGATDRVRIQVAPLVGIASAQLIDAPITRIPTVPPAGINAHTFIFQKVMIDTGLLQRRFSTRRNINAVVSSSHCERDIIIDAAKYPCGHTVQLSAGDHEITTRADWVRLEAAHAEQVNSGKSRILATTQAANDGMRAFIGGLELEPVTINAGSQGFILPDQLSEINIDDIQLSFAGEQPYRLGLLVGFIIAIATIGWCIFSCFTQNKHLEQLEKVDTNSPNLPLPPFLLIPTLGSVAVLTSCGWLGLLIAATTVFLCRLNYIRSVEIIAVCSVIAAMWMARAPWPSDHYTTATQWATFIISAALGALFVNGPRLHGVDH